MWNINGIKVSGGIKILESLIFLKKIISLSWAMTNKNGE